MKRVRNTGRKVGFEPQRQRLVQVTHRDDRRAPREQAQHLLDKAAEEAADRADRDDEEDNIIEAGHRAASYEPPTMRSTRFGSSLSDP